MHRQERVSQPSLPQPENHAYFPQGEINQALQKEVLKRAGKDNLVWAIGYGSQVSGDAGKRSMYDVMLVVEDVEKFHARNLLLRPFDYGQPHIAKWHALLNKFGFNFYHSHFKNIDNSTSRLKLAVISKKDFIRGCSGTVDRKEASEKGAFGMYVAGRVQKAALSPYKNEKDATVMEAAINTARIDGVWYALGFLNNKFTYDELVKAYVSLSYWADVRVEKSRKIETLIKNSEADYRKMLEPIIEAFIKNKLIKVEEEGFGWYEKVHYLSVSDTYLRLLNLKKIAFLTNYLKNPLSAGLTKGIIYVLLKVARVADSLPPVHRVTQKITEVKLKLGPQNQKKL